MNLDSTNIIYKEKNMDICYGQDDKNVVSVKGEIKTIYCDADILKDVLKVTENGITWREIEELYVPRYGEDAVRVFFKTLIDEKILNIFLADSKIADIDKILLLGSGKIKDELVKLLKDESVLYSESKINDFIREENTYRQDQYFAVIVLPENNTYGELLELNEKLMKAEVPFLLTYYNGSSVTLGPYVFPWKTACYECHVTHHVRVLNQNDATKGIALDDLRNVRAAYSLPKEYTSAQLRFICEVLLNVVRVSRESNAANQLVKKEKMISANQYHFEKVKTYQTISDCRCCRAMNKGFHTVSEMKIPDSNQAGVVERKIQYRNGGFRSLSKSETESLVENALEKVGLDISIKRVMDNPFADILPVFDSSLCETHNNKTPYFFGDQVSHGKGINIKQAYFSAAFELFERLSARYYGEKAVVRGTIKELKEFAIDIKSYIEQIHNNNTTYEKYDENELVDWVWGESLITGEPKLAPASMAFLTSTVFRGKYFNDTSSGLAAGGTLKDAILQGLLELVEHDAWLIGQCNPVRLPILDTSEIENEELKSVIEKIKAKGYKVISRDYTNDIGIPVIRTWISNPDNYTVYATSGVGASLMPEMALERSVTEAVQAAIPSSLVETTNYACPNMRDLIESRDSLYGLYYFQQKDIAPIGSIKKMSEYPIKMFDSVDGMLEEVLLRIRKAVPNCDVVFVNLTREAFGIPAVRVIITGDIQRLSMPLVTVSKRMYEFQRKMGYSEKVPAYEELYMGNYPH